MKTLIELFDERPIENVLAADAFRPERVIFLCPQEVAQNRALQNGIREYFVHRGLDVETVFEESSLFYAEKVKRQLERIEGTFPDCAMDITGGTDAALFAAGLMGSQSSLPVFTYSRRKNRFYNIRNAEFAEEMKYDAGYKAEDFFLMAGGTMKQGRVDNGILSGYMDYIDPFFNVYFRHKKQWVRFVTWMQRASAAKKDFQPQLSVRSSFSQKGERGSVIRADVPLLREVEGIGFIEDLRVTEENEICFSFRDFQVRTWLRDIGAVLELYVYKTCIDAQVFSDVRCSCVVGWESGAVPDSVENEIDVIGVRGTIPFFISCKTCAVDTDALNELAILRDRFGGQSSKAIVVTCEKCRDVTRRRADALDISVIDYDDIKNGRLKEHIIPLI